MKSIFTSMVIVLGLVTVASVDRIIAVGVAICGAGILMAVYLEVIEK